MSLHAVITGASGFIGSAVAANLIGGGHKVTVLLRNDSNAERLKRLTAIRKLRYSNLTDHETVASLKDLRPDVLIHCGWRGVGGHDRNEAFQITDNIRTSLDSVNLAAVVGCNRWIGLGSQAEYGNLNCRLNEDAHLRPTTIYGKAKLATGISCLALAETRGLSAAWIRVFSTYGPGDSPHWFLQYALREFQANRAPKLTLCTQLWDYLHVSDAAAAITLMAKTPSANGNFNLGSGKAIPLRQWVELLRQASNCSDEPQYGAIPFRPDQVMHLEADISKISAATGWRPRVTPEEGIASLVSSC